MKAPVGDDAGRARSGELRDTGARREVRSEDLLGDARVVLIRHADTTYTLRRTSNGRLILTK